LPAEISRETIVAWLHRYAADVAENRDRLTDLDGPIGDHDHGINMNRGFCAVAESLADVGDASNESVLKNVGMTLIKTVGGASGPLYGTVFLRMATTTSGKALLTAQDVGEMLRAGRQGIVDRGKAEVGDATMLDAWDPAVAAYGESVNAGQDLPAALEVADKAAEQGAQSTVPLVARKGRASYLGERGIGHQDPGATSSAMLFHALKISVQGDTTSNEKG